MPRRNSGPRLVWNARCQQYEISHTTRGRSRRCRTGTADRGRAEAALADFLIAQAARRAGTTDLDARLRHPNELLIARALAWYMAEHGRTVRSPRAIGYAVDRLLDWWADKTVGDITSSTLAGYRQHRESQGRKPATADREIKTLRAAVRWAYRTGRLTAPPPFSTIPRRAGRDRWLSIEEANRLLAAARDAPPHIELYVWIALYTGARHGAIVDLVWPQVDLERGIIRFLAPGADQSAKRRPAIRIPEPLRAMLALARQDARGLDHVITWRGRPVRSVRTALHRVVERAALGGVTGHVLRHTCATWLAQAGVPLWTIAGYLGHGTAAYTTELYVHHSPDAFDQVCTVLAGQPLPPPAARQRA